MKIVQLLGVDGQPVGLYTTNRTDEENFQETFDECERLAEMAEEQWADSDVSEDERDDASAAFENYLSERGFTRVFATEATTNLY